MATGLLVIRLSRPFAAVILLELQIQLPEEKQLPSFSWFYGKTRRSELVEAATMVNWQHISSLESVTDMWLTLGDWILDLRNRFVPYGPKKTGKDVPWIRSRHRRARQCRVQHGVCVQQRRRAG